MGWGEVSKEEVGDAMDVRGCGCYWCVGIQRVCWYSEGVLVLRGCVGIERVCWYWVLRELCGEGLQ